MSSKAGGLIGGCLCAIALAAVSYNAGARITEKVYTEKILAIEDSIEVDQAANNAILATYAKILISNTKEIEALRADIDKLSTLWRHTFNEEFESDKQLNSMTLEVSSYNPFQVKPMILLSSHPLTML